MDVNNYTTLIDLKTLRPVYLNTDEISQINEQLDRELIQRNSNIYAFTLTSPPAFEQNPNDMGIEPIDYSKVNNKSSSSTDTSKTHPAAFYPPTLTDDEHLSYIMERKGCYIPTSDEEKRNILSTEHALGHYGQISMYRKLIQKNIWWPKMRTDIAKELYSGPECLVFNISHTTFHPSRYITSSKPGDHF